MEKNVKLKAASTMMGAAMIMGGAMAVLPAEAVAQGVPNDSDAVAAFAQDAAELGLEDAVATQLTSVQQVQGEFSFDQATLTSNETMASVFQKAAATLCQTMPEYGVSMAKAGMGVIEVSGSEGSFSATIDELADGEDFGAIVGCACATNAPGGGAIANAEVEGVALATIAAMAQAI